MRQPKLGIFAGSGDLPGRIISTCREGGRDVFVVAFDGITDAEAIGDAPHAWVGLGAIDKTITLMHEAGCGDVVMAGPVDRISLSSLAIDRRGLKVLMRHGMSALGDNKLLSLIVAELEGENFRVVGIDDILSDILAPAGPIGTLVPDDEAQADIDAGVAVARALGALDVGQAVVVQQGVVLGVEAAEGTDALLARCATLRYEGRGGVMVKLKKPGQERRADLPTVGLRTIEAAQKAGLVGIVVEAGGSIVVDRVDVGRAADAAGLFVVGIEPGAA